MSNVCALLYAALRGPEAVEARAGRWAGAGRRCRGAAVSYLGILRHSFQLHVKFDILNVT